MRIGPIELEHPLALAPMDDVTDLSFRLICKDLGADLVYTEFASSEALIRDVGKTLQKIQVAEAERPVGVQIFGGQESSMEGAARVAEAANPDFIDINCGCWVKNVAKGGAGAALLKDIHRFEAVVRAVIGGTSLPVTVKTRLGWDPESIIIEDVARMVEQCGAAALTLHCRTRDQGHRGGVQWDWLEKVKAAVSIPVIGNGNVFTPEDAKQMFETGCDGVMIGRGAIQNPWIFQQTKHYLATGERLPDPTPADRLTLCMEHLKRSVEFKGERRGTMEFRKYYSGYLKGLRHGAKMRAELMQYDSLEPLLERLQTYKESLAAEEEAVA